MDKIELSYQAHKNNLDLRKEEIEERLFGIKNNDCIGYQATKNTVDVIKPFLKSRNRWLTIGDYNGLEANYLLKNNQDAVRKIYPREIRWSFLLRPWGI